MFRTTHIINSILGLLALSVILTVIIVKSTIANEVRHTSILTTQLDAEIARRDALQAEWARLQHRSTVLAIGQARFGGGVEEIAEEVQASDLPFRDTTTNGHAAALGLFNRAVSSQNAGTLPPFVLASADPISDLISQDLGQ